MFGMNYFESDAFLRACRLHDWTSVESMVRAGADVDALSCESMSPLMYSIMGKNDVIFDFLVSQGADLEQQNIEGETPIFWALTSDKMLRHILLFDVNVNHKNNNGVSPLMRAVQDINIETCILLLDAGADVNIVDECGYTCLMFAIEAQNLELCILCLDSGASVNAINDFQMSVLHFAIRTCDMIFIQLLFEYDVQITEEVVEYAMCCRHMHVVELFIGRGAPMKNILFECLTYGVYHFFPVLLKYGVDVHATKDGQTTMDILFQNWDPTAIHVCKELVQLGVSCILDTGEHIMERVHNIELLEWLSTHCTVQTDLEQECSICFESIHKYNQIKTECGHFFCRTCLSRWYQRNITCPLCRKEIDEENLCTI